MAKVIEIISDGIPLRRFNKASESIKFLQTLVDEEFVQDLMEALSTAKPFMEVIRTPIARTFMVSAYPLGVKMNATITVDSDKVTVGAIYNVCPGNLQSNLPKDIGIIMSYVIGAFSMCDLQFFVRGYFPLVIPINDKAVYVTQGNVFHLEYYGHRL